MSEYSDASAAYLESIRQELPLYDRLQDELIKATYGVTVKRILDLGCGTGETSRRCLEAYPDAELTGIDPSEPLLRIARSVLGEGVLLRLADLDEALPRGPFDLVVSALSLHELPTADHRELFRNVRKVIAPRGRFVIADLVTLSSETTTPPGASEPVRMELLRLRLRETGFASTIAWTDSDLAVLASAPS